MKVELETKVMSIEFDKNHFEGPALKIMYEFSIDKEIHYIQKVIKYDELSNSIKELYDKIYETITKEGAMNENL